MTKKITKKEEDKEEKRPVVKKAAVKLVSYTLTAVIPHARYGNLQPSITVEADSLESAREFIYPHIEELMSKYQEDQFGKAKFVPGRQEKEPSQEEKDKIAEDLGVKKEDTKNEVVTPEVVKETTIRSEPFQKAYSAISGAMSLDVMEVIKNQLEISVKLTEDEKTELWVIFNEKLKSLSGDQAK